MNEKRHWAVSAEKCTGCNDTEWHQAKKDMSAKMARKLAKEKQHGREVKLSRMNNAGENKELEKITNKADNELDVCIECAARNTP